MLQDAEQQVAEQRYRRTERLFVAAYVLCLMVLQTHFVHDGWFALLHPPGWQQTAPARPGIFAPYAPDIYRIGMELVNLALFYVLPDPSSRLTLIDFVFGCPALYALYLLQAACVSLHVRDRAYRVITLAFFLAATHFALVWVPPYQRPETMAMALYLADATLMLLRVRSGARWAFGLTALTFVAAFFRSDVPCIFGAAIFLLGLGGDALRDIAPRRTCMLLGGGVAAIAVGVQAAMQFVVFPHAVYPPGVPVVMFHYNVRFHSLSSLLIVLLPLVMAVAAAVAVRVRMRSLDWLCIAAAALYLPLWFTVGSTAEVRIYVPFLLLLCPVAARIMAAVLGFHEDMHA